jgi:GNAT superfamily N-acetyltransferase
MVEIRVAETDEEVQACLDLVSSLYPNRAMLLEEVREIEAAVPDQARFQALEEGRIVGTASIMAEPRLRERRGAHASIVAARDERGRGVGTGLYRALSEWARARELEELEGAVKQGEDESLRWVERRGFAETARESMLTLELAAIEAPAVDPPNGVEIVSWAGRPELVDGMYEVALEAYPDIPGNEDDAMESFEEWLTHDMTGPGDLPEATFVALAVDEVVGFAKFSLTRAQPTIAWHDVTGVKRAWRGRGIAGALKRAEIAWAKEQGYERLQTMNEERNAPIRKLNERYGYRLAPGRIFVVGPLAP